ncbi:hypothetical protein IEQ34_020139 [Dendrobium chrysotoxum]|uniref:Dirigent protein n=1 Tax=Dendrobium chrysotoxum TaxID=161865 RepID=A0AAV7G1M7_DENCH|nr:hypothetical protein IEQ34_020139 [Dendrobium chrysotoxum]
MDRLLLLLLLPLVTLLLTAAGGVNAKEKLIHLRFYWHDILSGPNPTAVTIARSPVTNASATLFGSMNVIDDPLTLGPDLSSRQIGRAQGIYASADQNVVGLFMVMNFVFVDGKYNGSTLAVLGHNQVFSSVREMPIVGGTMLFRLARGYVRARTYSFRPETGDAVVEYNCYVLRSSDY